MLFRALTYVGRHGALFLAFGVLIGLALPGLAAAARPLLMPALLVPFTIALLRLDWRHLHGYVRRPGLVAIVTAWLLGASPLLMWLVLAVTPLPHALEYALVLMAASSPVTMCATISVILGLDTALAVIAVIVATALMPFTLPAIALPLLGLALDIDLRTFILRLALMVGVAFAVALAARRFVGPERLARGAYALDAAAVISLLVFAVAIMDGVTAAALDRPGYVLGTVAAAFGANLALQLAGTLAFLKLGVRRALTIGLLTGNCNMGIILVALADKADFDTVMFFALGQIPMYMLPALLRPVYRRVLAGKP
jgi:BASS family bile acid:Na+ symporter